MIFLTIRSTWCLLSVMMRSMENAVPGIYAHIGRPLIVSLCFCFKFNLYAIMYGNWILFLDWTWLWLKPDLTAMDWTWRGATCRDSLCCIVLNIQNLRKCVFLLKWSWSLSYTLFLSLSLSLSLSPAPTHTHTHVHAPTDVSCVISVKTDGSVHPDNHTISLFISNCDEELI